mgnify:CR=1 FL=1|tara:strand:+ start:478 stop:606 length:129 start_codon:yes stop_codon:yes gene_type:complete
MKKEIIKYLFVATVIINIFFIFRGELRENGYLHAFFKELFAK